MKKLSAALICVVFLVLNLCSCNKKNENDVIFLNDFIQCDITESGNKFGFNLIYLYKGSKPDVEFSSFQDPSIDSMFEEMIDDTFESISEKEYRGYKAKILGFCFDTTSMSDDSTLSIENIELLVNDEKVVLDTTDKIKLNKVSSEEEKYYCSSVYSTSVPVIIFSQGKGLEAVSFFYHTEHSAEIESFDFSNYINITESEVYVNDILMGSIDDVFPLQVEADSSIQINIGADFGEYNSFSDFYMNSLLSYHSMEDGNKVLKDYVAVQAVGNMDDLTHFIDEVLGEE